LPDERATAGQQACDELSLGVHTDPSINGGEMVADRALAEKEVARDRGHALATQQAAQDLELALADVSQCGFAPPRLRSGGGVTGFGSGGGNSTFGGGVARKWEYEGDDESRARPEGWVARRWDPAVRARFIRLLQLLGRAVDGRIEGLNLPETSIDFGTSGKLHPRGFTYAGYVDGVKAIMSAVRRIEGSGGKA